MLCQEAAFWKWYMNMIIYLISHIFIVRVDVEQAWLKLPMPTTFLQGLYIGALFLLFKVKINCLHLPHGKINATMQSQFTFCLLSWRKETENIFKSMLLHWCKGASSCYLWSLLSCGCIGVGFRSVYYGLCNCGCMWIIGHWQTAVFSFPVFWSEILNSCHATQIMLMGSCPFVAALYFLLSCI